MNKKDLKKLVLLGISAGVLLSAKFPESNLDNQFHQINALGQVFAVRCVDVNTLKPHRAYRKPNLSDRRDQKAFADSGYQRNVYTGGRIFEKSEGLENEEMTEQEFLSHLDERVQATYRSLSQEGKQLALEFANRHSNLQDKNLAVEMAVQKMTEKRTKTL